MKVRKFFLLTPAFLLAAGCAHNQQQQQQQAQFDESISPLNTGSAVAGSASQGSEISANTSQQGGSYTASPSASYTVNNQLQVSTESASVQGAEPLSATSRDNGSSHIYSSDPSIADPTFKTNSDPKISAQTIAPVMSSSPQPQQGPISATTNQPGQTLAVQANDRIFAPTHAPSSTREQQGPQPISATSTRPDPAAADQFSSRISAQTNAPIATQRSEQQPLSATSSRPGQGAAAQSQNKIYAQTNAPGWVPDQQPISATSSRPAESGGTYANTNSVAPSSSQSEPSSTGQSGAVNVNVQGSSQADRTLAQQISQELRADAGLASSISQISISVADGRVSLRGNVKNEQQKREIESVIQRVTGVSSVDNQLQVSANPTPPMNP
jgi:hypothetical protein